MRRRMKILRVVMVTVAAVVATTVVGVSPAHAQQFIMRDFGTDQGWQGDRHPRFVVDVTGDRRADVVGFGETGVHTAVATGDGSYAPSFQVSNVFGYNAGWRVGQHDRFVADINGDAHADIVGIRETGVFTALSIGGGFFGRMTQVSTGLNSDVCTIRQMADANGDGRSDLFCIRDGQILLALARGDGGGGTPIPGTTPVPGLRSPRDTTA